jgi:hypothetical protein
MNSKGQMDGLALIAYCVADHLYRESYLRCRSGWPRLWTARAFQSDGSRPQRDREEVQSESPPTFRA